MNLLEKVKKAHKGGTYLIMRPEAREELKFLIAEEEGIDIMEVLNDELNVYKNLTVAICMKRTFPDFVIC